MRPSPIRAARAMAFRRFFLRARKVLGWPKICKLVHGFLWKCRYKTLKLAQLLDQLGVFRATVQRRKQHRESGNTHSAAHRRTLPNQPAANYGR
jgi:hypothetical protein